ncbi:MAG: hypothetical protein EBE86_026725 [Hormoscilla sp. GUM202]|nr:hypothetical protein [Hormoscilla sp. GUM202]
MAELKAKVTLKQKGEAAYISVKQLLVTLKWTAAVDLDLMAFYKAKDGRVGAVFSENYAGGSLGSLNSFPFIQLSGDAGVGAVGGNNEETLRITKLDDLEQLYICTLNFTDAVYNRDVSFGNYDAYVVVVDEKSESIGVFLDSQDPGVVAVIAKIDNTDFMGPKLVNENHVMSLAMFKATIPGANLLQLTSKIVLKQKGDRAPIPVKNLRVTMKWKAAVDLDLHTYFQTKLTAPAGGNFFTKLLGGGSGKPGDEGHVYYANRGSKKSFPWIYLDRDAGIGDRGGDNEENLYFTDLQYLEHILIVANIYNKPKANFASYDGKVIVKADYRSFEVPLTATTGGNNCIIAHVDNSRASGPVLVNVNKVQRHAPTVAEFLYLP